jgi:hypothetical protein
MDGAVDAMPWRGDGRSVALARYQTAAYGRIYKYLYRRVQIV